MSAHIELPGKIDDSGKLKLLNEKMMHEWIKGHREKDVTVSIEVKKKRRSNPQNGYYHGVVIPLIRQGLLDLGNDVTKEETHEFLKAKFNYKEVEVGDGHYLDIPQSTTKLDTVGFMAFIAKIQQFASEMLGIYIPDPNENLPF